MSDDDITRLPEDDSKSNLLSAGQQFGQYKVIRLLGRGGMGEVYEVENPILGKRFALKLISREIMQRPEAVERFEREAMVMSGFDHPNIVKVDDFGEIEGHAVLRMELVCADGATSLADLLNGEPLSETLVVDLLKQILEGLAYAHEKGVVHRDLKPSNILLQPNPLKPDTYIPKITDFGLVRLAGEEWLQSQVQLTVARSMTSSDTTRLDDASGSVGTSTQALLGTFEFMAAEQKKGQEATIHSDLYAIGLIAFRMLTGHESPGMETASQLMDGLNPEWDAWLIRAMKRTPDDRHCDAEKMSAAMPKAGVSVTLRASSVEHPKKSKAGLCSVLSALTIIGGVLGYYFGVYQPEQKHIKEEARLAEVARLQAEEAARLKAEREAEEERLAAEAARRAEEERLAAEAARLLRESDKLRVAQVESKADLAIESEEVSRLDGAESALREQLKWIAYEQDRLENLSDPPSTEAEAKANVERLDWMAKQNRLTLYKLEDIEKAQRVVAEREQQRLAQLEAERLAKLEADRQAKIEAEKRAQLHSEGVFVRPSSAPDPEIVASIAKSTNQQANFEPKLIWSSLAKKVKSNFWGRSEKLSDGITIQRIVWSDGEETINVWANNNMKTNAVSILARSKNKRTGGKNEFVSNGKKFRIEVGATKE